MNMELYKAVGQNQWYHVGVGAPDILVYFSGDWDTGFDGGKESPFAISRLLGAMFGSAEKESHPANCPLSACMRRTERSGLGRWGRDLRNG